VNTPQDDPNWSQYPPEVQNALMEQHNKLQMEADDFRHSIIRFIHEASYDHLMTARNMMHNITWSTRPDIFSAHYEGQIAMELEKRFNLCPACNIDHDKDLGLDNPSSQGSDSPETPDQPIEELADSGKVYINTYKDLTEADLQHCIQYGLDDMRADGTDPEHPEGKLLGFVCIRCGRMQWPTIADRMKDPSDESGCSGCRQKAKWG